MQRGRNDFLSFLFNAADTSRFINWKTKSSYEKLLSCSFGDIAVSKPGLFSLHCHCHILLYSVPRLLVLITLPTFCVLVRICNYAFIDPLGRPTIKAGSDHCLHTCCPYVRPTFQNIAKQNEFQVKTMFTTGEIVGLAEWIIDDTLFCFLYFCLRISLWRSRAFIQAQKNATQIVGRVAVIPVPVRILYANLLSSLPEGLMLIREP